MGRRIYIHSESFAFLAKTSLQAAIEVEGVLRSTTVLKIVHHQLADVGVDLGLVDRRTAIRIEKAFRAEFGGGFSTLLRRIGYRPRRPSAFNRFDPVLGPSEGVAASCQDSGYLTFATDTASGLLMYADHVRLHQLWVEFVEERGDSHLTMIKGQCLAFLDPSIPIGANAGPAYEHLVRADVVPAATLDDIRREVSDRLESTAQSIIARTCEANADLDPQLVDDVSAAIRAALRVGPATTSKRTQVTPLHALG